IAKQSEGRVGEKYLPVAGWVECCAQWETNRPTYYMETRASLVGVLEENLLPGRHHPLFL
ncbi:MAG: hypothetical protein ABIQ24_08795, partial [Nitrospiraceae bacterium]